MVDKVATQTEVQKGRRIKTKTVNPDIVKEVG